MELKINAIIVDDEKNSRMMLRSMIGNFCPDVTIIGQAGDIEEAAGLINLHYPELVFLDIEMPHGSGLKLLERYPERNFEVIFVTGFDKYAIEAIKARTLDYLLKPVDIDELSDAVALAKKRIQEKAIISSESLKQISIPTTQGKEFIKVEDIVFCEADGPCTWIQLENRRLYSSKNLGEFEKILPNATDDSRHGFFRIHHRFLVNFGYIVRFERRANLVELTIGNKLPLAQRRKSEFFNLLKNKGQ